MNTEKYPNFNLEKALQGNPVVTRDGRKVTEIYHLKTISNQIAPVVAVIDGMTSLYRIDGTTENGYYFYTLCMAPLTIKKWVNLYLHKGNPDFGVVGKIYNSKESAEADRNFDDSRIACVEIEVPE